MQYKDLLKTYIDNSGLSLREIEERMRTKGFSTNKAYISKLQNGIHPPAGEDITRALAEVTGGNAEKLLLAGYIEKAPEELKTALTEAPIYNYLHNRVISEITGRESHDPYVSDKTEGLTEEDHIKSIEAANVYKFLFLIFYDLTTFLERYRSNKEIDIEKLSNLEDLFNQLKSKHDYMLPVSPLYEFPEYAAELVAKLKQEFYPNINVINFRTISIDLTKYVSSDGKPIFVSDPYPEVLDSIERSKALTTGNRQFETDEYEQELNKQQKMNFFKELERDLKLDLSDPTIQKQIKRAAKIFFSEED